ncbi:MAG: ComF family protein [Clostridia bacterium]|nr:ComF family protein [Clostridia bacterium]MBQ9945209.1 ComF family protein [Clostridia bacterium]
MKLTDIFFPPRCAGCDTITEDAFPVCKACNELRIRPFNSKNRCDTCFLSVRDCICTKRQYFSKLSVCFFYDGPPKRTVFRMKFRARPDIAKAYAKLIYLSLQERELTDSIDAVTFVPMGRYRKFKRGYNQSELLARHIARLCNKPCIPFLIKESTASVQHDTKKIFRKGNLLGIYEPDKKYEAEIKGKRILVADDVTTTYSTFNEIAKTLLIFGADEVYAAACTATKKSKKY